jgi:heat shock protein HslJ
MFSLGRAALLTGLACLLLTTTLSCSDRDRMSDLIGQWRLVEFVPAGISVESEVTVEFQGSSNARGQAGCNNYQATYEARRSGLLRINVYAVTEMACTGDPDPLEFEAGFLATLEEATEFELEGDRLVIHSAKDGGVLEFVRR